MKRIGITVVLSLILFFSAGMLGSDKAYAAHFTHTEADSRVIPDKYNTGVKGDLEKISADDEKALQSKYYGLPFKKASSGSLVINFASKKDISGTFTFENLDFSAQGLAIYNPSLATKTVKLVFNNCKFHTFNAKELNDNVSYEFHNCTFRSVEGTNMDLYNCYVSGGQSDGIRAFSNTNVIDCYIADKSQVNGETSQGNHTDGTQIYGTTDATCTNIHFENCRFELPQFKGATAYINACIMLQIEYCDADDITFKNCKVNGGGFSIYAWSKKNTYKLTNAVIENVEVGCANRYGSVYYRVGKDVTLDNITDTDSLYVASVWKEGNKAHISVSNDTNDVRTLKVVTNLGEQTYEIKACPLAADITSTMKFEDLPFDIDIEVGAVKWLVCYDTTLGRNKQIRFVDFSDNMISDSLVASNITKDLFTSTSTGLKKLAKVVAEGTCGKNIQWTLKDDGVLLLEGTGATYNYTSGKNAPWREYIDKITTITVAEGVTRLGHQLFRDCHAVTSVKLPSSLTSMGSIVFQKCTSLKEIEIPAKVTSIGDRCFAADKLEKVTYLGTNWGAITIGEHNGPLTSALVK